MEDVATRNWDMTFNDPRLIAGAVYTHFDENRGDVVLCDFEAADTIEVFQVGCDDTSRKYGGNLLLSIFINHQHRLNRELLGCII